MMFETILPVIVGVVAGGARAIADGRFVPPEKTEEGWKLHEVSQLITGGIGGFIAIVFLSDPGAASVTALGVGLGLITIKDIAAKLLEK